MTKADIHHQDKRLEKALEKHLPAFNGDREDVKEFLNQLTVEGLSAARVSKYIYTLLILRRMLKVDFKSASEHDIKRLVASIEKSGKSDWTKHDYKVALKRFLRYLDREPSWLKVSNGKSKNALPEEILVEEEVKRIAEAACTNRDKAFVMSLYESGCRIGEFLPLRIKHLSFDKHGATIRVTGKTGARRVRLVFCALPLQRWLSEHPGKDDPNSFLWCQIPGPYHPGQSFLYLFLVFTLGMHHLHCLVFKFQVIS
jgi:integrase